MEGMDRGVVSRVRCCREVQKYKDGNACRTQWHGNHRDSGVSQFGGSGEGGGQSRMGYKVTVGVGFLHKNIPSEIKASLSPVSWQREWQSPN